MGATNVSHVVPPIIAAAVGVLLFAGLWTPIAGALVALLELWTVFSRQDEFWASVLAAAIASGLALLGPGAWSVDALTYGRRRISIPDRSSLKSGISEQLSSESYGSIWGFVWAQVQSESGWKRENIMGELI
jgi:hypothetical protein